MTREEYIKSLIKESGRNVKEFANDIDIPYTTLLSMLKNLGGAAVDSIIKICDELSITVEQLNNMGEHEETGKYTTKENEMISMYRKLDFHGKDIIDTILTKEYDRCTEREIKPIIRTVNIEFPDGLCSAGTGEMLSDDECIKQLTVEETSESLKADFAVEVSGNSMEPTFYDGDIVLVRKQPMVYKGEIGIFDVDGEGYIKEFGCRELISHNKKYKPIKLTPYTDFRCFGLVLGVANVIN